MQRTALCTAILTAVAMPACAQSGDGQEAPRRYRIALGAQAVPSYPGADHNAVRPMFDLAIARGDAQFEYEAADESPNITFVDRDGLEAGVAIGLQSARTRRRVGADLTRVSFSVEPGVFAGYYLTPQLRAYAELRKGVSGHEGVVGLLALD